MPEIQINKKEIQLHENGSFSVECSANGVPTPTVRSTFRTKAIDAFLFSNSSFRSNGI